MKVEFEDIVDEIEDKLMVETKEGGIKGFVLNNIQRSFVHKILKYKKDYPDRPLRIIILKGRQFGFSTFILAWFFVKCLLVPNTRAAVISHEGEATKKLFRRVRFFSNTVLIKPTLDKESEREYSFPKTNSYFYVGTAGQKAFARGDNLTDVHCSEVAFWESPGVVMNGLLQAVGMTGNAIIETTANGVGNYFYKLWQKSYRNQKSAWYAIFFKWTNFREYQLPVPVDFRRTEEEELICNLHREITDGQLMWRRWKISETETEPGFTPEQIFKQEYPLTPHEAFIHSGRPVYSIKALEAFKCPPAIDQEDGWLIWKEPSGYSVCGIDVAEGRENNDRHVIDIYDEKLEQVAHWAGWCDIDELAVKAITVMDRYNSYCVPEVNGPGIKFMGYLKEGVYREGINICHAYPLHKVYKREEFDQLYREKKLVPGWRTTIISRQVLINTHIQYIREHAQIINNPDTIEEMLSFVKNKDGKPEAADGANDDRVIASALAVIGYRDHPPKLKDLDPETKAKAEKDKINKQWRKERLIKVKKRQIMRKRIYK